MEINGKYSDPSYDVDQAKLAAAARIRAINTAVDLVKSAVRSLTDEDRKRVLDLALRELSSTLCVQKGGGLFYSLFQR